MEQGENDNNNKKLMQYHLVHSTKDRTKRLGVYTYGREANIFFVKI